jgi:glycerate 2-kinase
MKINPTNHLLIAPGAFKGSLTAAAAARAIERGLRRAGLQQLRLLPIADGGDGTLDAFVQAGASPVPVQVLDPLGRPHTAAYAVLTIDDTPTAVIEMAKASGLALLRRDELDPMRASTYGTGELMRAALEGGARRTIIGMGGSATNDGGAGCLQALGVRLLDEDGRDIPPGGGGLALLHTIDVTGLDPRWREVEVIIASDVENPPVGERGAAAVFGPQKGATAEQIRILDANLLQFFTLISEQLGVDVRTTPGGGAAGAFSAGLMAFLNGRIESGVDLILDLLHFEALLDDTALVVTGEGRMDSQTVDGKGPIGVARRARVRGVPTVALVGGLLDEDGRLDERLHEAGIAAVLPIVSKPMPLEEAISRGAELLEVAALRLGYLLQL